MKKKPVNYVNNADLFEAMVEYKTAYNQGLNPQISNYIGECIILIANKMTCHRWFNGYSEHWKQEMVGDAIENCVMYLYNFDHEKYSNVFAYLTQIVYFAFRRRLETERKTQAIKIKNTDNFFIENQLAQELLSTSAKLYENNHEFLKVYEKNLAAKKKKAKAVGVEKFI